MHVSEVRIENIRTFGTERRKVALDFSSPQGDLPKWVVVAGRNGAGKSTLLQAIALAIAGPAASKALRETFAGWLREGVQTGLAAAHLRYSNADGFQQYGRTPKFQPWVAVRWTAQAEGPEPLVEAERVGGNWTPARGPWAANPTGWFLAGYGPFRRLSTAPTEAQRLMMIAGRPSSLASLFHEAASLSEAVVWLQQVYLRRLESNDSYLEDLVIRLLRDGLLPEGLEVQRVTSEGLWVRSSDGIELPLSSLSDGYRTVAALVLDIVRQFQQTYGSVELDDPIEGTRIMNEGVVLIDEIDVHLHVSWQQNIGFWLKRHFPNTQFLVTTHSPFICQAADQYGLVRLPAPGEDRDAEIISGELFNRIVHGTPDEAVLTDLFGLERPYSVRSSDLRREITEIEAEIARGAAGEDAIARLRSLRDELPQTLSADVAIALDRLAKSN